MLSYNDDHISSDSSDIDICNTSPNVSARKLVDNTTSTPHLKYTPRVNFRSIESLAISSLNTSSLTPHSSPFSLQRNDDTGYNSSNITFEKENIKPSRKPRRKLTDWQVWHLRQSYTANRYPTPLEQEQLAQQLLLPLSTVRIWFQNHRARAGRQ